MTWFRITTLVALTAVVLTLTGCSRDVDQATTGGQIVPGTGNLFRFCDESTLIYYSDWSSDSDNFEAFFAGWCSLDPATGEWLPAIGEPRTTNVPTAPGLDDTNQQDERDEG